MTASMIDHANFQPDYRHFATAMQNRRPQRLPLYEHIVNSRSMEKILGIEFADLANGDRQDLNEFFRHYCRFFREMTYDTVSFEVCIGGILPGPSAICGGQGPLQSRADFDAYPWAELPARFRQAAYPQFDALIAHLPPGMKAVGGVGNGVFELAESLVGMEFLPFVEVDDPDLYAELFRAIGNTMAAIWSDFVARYGEHFVACRFGDDLGFKCSLLTNPTTVRQHIVPQYRRVVDIIHAAGRPFLWHSCGCIFEVMEDMLAIGIDAKHSNEDAIAPFATWIDRYGQRIALLGGFDMDFLCQKTAEDVYAAVVEQGRQFRAQARGYALGSGNSIPEYVPSENYLAMIRAAQTLRAEEGV